MNKYALIQALGQLQRRPYRARFEACKDDPARAQAERLRAIVSHTKATEFARKHHVGDVRSLRDLQTRLPIQDGSTLRPFIEREMRGERHVLCAEKPLLYACSSGTTGEPKLMPTTNTFRREFQTSLLTSMAYVYERHKACFEGSVLYYVAKKEIAKAPDGTPIGYTSGFNFSRMPRIVKEAYAVPYEAFEIADAEGGDFDLELPNGERLAIGLEGLIGLALGLQRVGTPELESVVHRRLALRIGRAIQVLTAIAARQAAQLIDLPDVTRVAGAA